MNDRVDFGVPSNLSTSYGLAPSHHEMSGSDSQTSTVRRWEVLWNLIRQPLPASMEYAAHASTANVIHASARASAFDLKLYAEKRLAFICATGDAAPTLAALVGLRGVVADFVADNGPTPQVGATQSGSVEVQWLSGGTLIAALFDKSGDYNLWGVDPDEGVLFDEDVASGQLPPAEVRAEIVATLEKMKHRVTVRPDSWY